MSRRLLIIVVVLGILLTNDASAPPPAPPPITLPGPRKGRIESRWIAPYVAATTEQVGSRRVTSVRWFDVDGKVVRKVSGPGVYASPYCGFVSNYTNGLKTIHAVNGDWKITLPKKPGAAGYITGTPDSRTFVNQFHPEQGEIAVDVYVLGKLISTIGPFIQYKGQGVQLGPDGSLTFIVWKNKEKNVAQVVAVDPNGKIRFQADCEYPIDSPVIAPGGAGVLVRLNVAGNGYDHFMFYDKSGKLSSFSIGPNPIFSTWLPGSSKSLFWTSVGYKYRYQLIDCETEQKLWDIPDPSADHARYRGIPQTTALKDYVLLGGLEFMTLGEHEGPVRSIYALDTTSGTVVAHWLPVPCCHFCTDSGRFVKIASKLFLIWGDEFAEVKLEDIVAKKNGWR